MLKMYTPKNPAKLKVLPGTWSFSLSLLACYHVCGPQVHIEYPLAGFPFQKESAKDSFQPTQNVKCINVY